MYKKVSVAVYVSVPDYPQNSGKKKSMNHLSLPAVMYKILKYGQIFTQTWEIIIWFCLWA